MNFAMRQSLIPIASLALLFSLSACADDVSTEGTDDAWLDAQIADSDDP